MLKLIAEDYIKLEHLETVKPLYRELVKKPSLNLIVSHIIFLLIKKIQDILSLLKSGLTS